MAAATWTRLVKQLAFNIPAHGAAGMAAPTEKAATGKWTLQHNDVPPGQGGTVERGKGIHMMRIDQSGRHAPRSCAARP